MLHCAYSGLGGHAAVLFTLLASSESRQSEHAVVFFGVEPLRPEYIERCRELGVSYVYVRKKGRVGVRSYARVLRAIRDFGPDVVMINGSPLAVPLLLWRSVSGRGWGAVVRETQANHLKSRGEWVGSYVAAWLSDAVAYLTPEYKVQVDDSLWPHPRRRGTSPVIPNGVEVGPPPVTASRRPGAPLQLSMVSRVVPIKDHPTLIEAVRRLVHDRGHVHLRLRIAGGGPMLDGLREQVRVGGLGEHVEFLGVIGAAEVTSLLRATDIYVHSTLGETMSNSLLQAMAAGLPLVASAVDGVTNMIRDGIDGVLVPPQDPGMLTDGLERLIASPERRRVLGRAAWERARFEYSKDTMAERYADLFDRVASRVGQ